MSVGSFEIAVSPMTRIASARTITACGFLSAALTIGSSHCSQQILEHRPRRIADEAYDMIIDNTRRELVAARAAASDRVAGFQFPLRLWKIAELAFLKDDHRHWRLGTMAQNQRDRYAFDVTQARAARRERRPGRPIGERAGIEPPDELLRDFFRHDAAELWRGQVVGVSAVTFLDGVGKVESS